MKKRKEHHFIKRSRFEKSLIYKLLPFFLFFLIVILIILFYFFFTNFSSVLSIESDGYFLNNTYDISILKDGNLSDNRDFNIIKSKSGDLIYKRLNEYYIDKDYKKSINFEMPFFDSDGHSIINYNNNVNVISSKFVRDNIYENTKVSLGKLFQNNLYQEQINNNDYLLLSYADGTYINVLYLFIDTELNHYEIPLNSLIYFDEKSINYMYEKDNKYYLEKITDIDYKSKLTFFCTSLNINHGYTYEKFYKGIGNEFSKEKLVVPPKNDIVKLEDQIEENVNENVDNFSSDSEGNVDTDVDDEDSEYDWFKPTVRSSKLTATTYSIKGNIEINDPAGVIVKSPTYTIYEDSRVYARKTFYSTTDFTISGFKPNTKYKIVGQYTYLADDLETNKQVTFYSGTITTKDIEGLNPVDFSFNNGNLYSNKIEIKNVKLKNSLDDEVLKGIKKIVLVVDEKEFILNNYQVFELVNGRSIDVETLSSLKSSSKYNFYFKVIDRGDNILKVTNNSGIASTCKYIPVVTQSLKEMDTDYVSLRVRVRNDDNVELKNFKYYIYNSSGALVKSGDIINNQIIVRNLNPEELYISKVYADYDIQDGNGIKKENLMSEFSFTTMTVKNLGLLQLITNYTSKTYSGVSMTVLVNQAKTDARLKRMISKAIFELIDVETNESVYKEVVRSNKLSNFIAGEGIDLTISNLKSNHKYKLICTSIVVQGEKSYTFDTVIKNYQFETTKIPAKAEMVNSFVTSNMIDFDLRIVDVDNTVLNNEVIIKLLDKNKKTVSVKKMKVNEDFERLTYNNLNENVNYELIISTNEYNETNNNSTFLSNHIIVDKIIKTESGISGKIELYSSIRKSNGNNLLDINSNSKWIETTQYYNLNKTIDDNGNMHIYSKTGNSVYTYDLSDYEGEIVTATFKIKAIKTQSSKSIYFGNYVSGATGSNYAMKLNGITDSSWKTFKYTFQVGSYLANSTYRARFKTGDRYYGKNSGNFVGFMLYGANANLAEYEIKDFEVHYEAQTSKDIDVSIENGSYSGVNKVNTDAAMKYNARINSAIPVQKGKYYRINFKYSGEGLISAYSSFTRTNKGILYNTGWYGSRFTFYATEDGYLYTSFRNANGNLPIDVSLIDCTVEELEENTTSVKYEQFSYDLYTRVKVNITDLRKEITNHRYFIKVYDENGTEIISNGYTELSDVLVIKNAIKEVDLKEGEKYKVELGFYIRDRYYSLSSFDLETYQESVSIDNLNDWSFIQPNGNYVVSNDLNFSEYTSQILGWGYKYFYGTIDFQGHKAILHTKNTSYTRINRLEQTAVIKNMVLDVTMDNNFTSNNYQGFINTNYGKMYNIMVNIRDNRKDEMPDYYFSTLCNSNSSTGSIYNYVINLENDIHLYTDSAAFVRYNYGSIKNGYSYGGNIIASIDWTGTRTLGLITRYNGVRGVIKNAYTLNNMIFPHGRNSEIGSFFSWENYGKVENVYSVGDVNYKYLSNGPLVSYMRGTGSMKNAYYLNERLYTSTIQQKMSTHALNNRKFQKKILSDNFLVDEMMELGYYPHIDFGTDKLPSQPFIDLPEVSSKDDADILSIDVLESTNDSAIAEVLVSNPFAEKVTDISIENVDVTILDQTYDNKESVVKVRITNPTKYVSRYSVRSISTIGIDEHTSIHDYLAGEKYLYVDFFKEIYTVDDWIKINKNLSQNYKLMKDLDFSGLVNIFLNNFSGVIDGGDHIISNIDISVSGKNGLINQMNGRLQNINFVNIKKTSDSTNSGLIGYSNQNGKFDNVHVKNIYIEVPSDRKTNTVYVGGLVGNVSQSLFNNSSVSDVKIISNATISEITVGGLVGYSYGGRFENCYVDNVDINIDNSISTNGVGGLIGRSTWTDVDYVSNCYTTGNIYNSSSYTGGLIGYSTSNTKYSYSTVNVSSSLYYVGGLFGYLNSVNYSYKNVYYGNIFNEIETSTIGKISGNLDDTARNYVYSDSLVNGSITTSARGANMISYEEFFNDTTYTENIELGSQYNYDDVSKGYLPKLKYLDEDKVIENQPDIKIPETLFSVLSVVVNKHADFSEVVINFNNKYNYKANDIYVRRSNIDIMSIDNDEYTKTTIIRLKLTPEYYLDSYNLNYIIYENEEGKENKYYINYSIVSRFYKHLKNIDDWMKIRKDIAENYIVDNDIDFTDFKKLEHGIKVNRLETISEDNYVTLKGINLHLKSISTHQAFISSVSSSIKNIIFDNYKIIDDETRNNHVNYFNLILYNYATLSNVEFRNGKIYAPNKNYVATIGHNYSKNIENVKVTNVEVEGYNYNSALFGSISYGADYVYKDITGTNLNVKSNNEGAGGLFGNVSGGVDSNVIRNVYKNINVSDSNIEAVYRYAGGIAGLGDATNSTVRNVTVTAKSYVGGATGYTRSAYNYNGYVYDSHISASVENAGGYAGYINATIDTYVYNTEILGTTANTKNIGGLGGLTTTGGWLSERCGVIDSHVSNEGINAGGISGYQNGLHYSTTVVNNTVVMALSSAGGLTGNFRSGSMRNSIVENSNIVAHDHAGGVAGKFDNYVYYNTWTEGYLYRIAVLNNIIKADMNAGGFFGGMSYEFHYPQNSYSLYYDSTVTCFSTKGLVSGDKFDISASKLRWLGFYENSKIGNKNTSDYKGFEYIENDGNIGYDKITYPNRGFLNSLGESEINYSYFNAVHTDFIELRKDNLYRLKSYVNTTGNLYVIKIYNTDGKFIGDYSSGNANSYIPSENTTNNYFDLRLRVIKDCKIKIMFYDEKYISSTYIKKLNDTNNLYADIQFLSASDLKERLTWTRYLINNSTSIDNYNITKLNFDTNFNYDNLNSNIGNLTVNDNFNNKTAIVNASEHSFDGLLFNGVNNTMYVDGGLKIDDKITYQSNIRLFGSKNFQFIFSNYDNTKAANGFSVFVHNQILYIGVNRAWYSTSYPLSYYKTYNIAVTYDNVNANVYVDGELIYTNMINRKMINYDNVRVYFVGDKGYSSSSYLFRGTISNVCVYNRILSNKEIKDNLSYVSNSDGLLANYDLSNIKNVSDGYYPDLKNVKSQSNVKLPSVDDVDVAMFGINSNDEIMTIANEDKLSNLIDIYQVGLNLFNVEFKDLSSDLKMKIKSGNYESEILNVDRKVYTIAVDYNSPLEITLSNYVSSDTYKYNLKDYFRTISRYSENNYYIKNKKLYKNDKKIFDGVLSIYNNLVLFDDGRVYSIKDNDFISYLFENNILSYPVPINSSKSDMTILNTYYNFTEIIDDKGNISYKKSQIYSLKDNVFMFNNSNEYNNFNIYNYYDNDKYQITLGKNNSINSYISKIKYPLYFNNRNITEIYSNTDADETVLIVKYLDNSIVSFDYVTGVSLYNNNSDNFISLNNFIKNSFKVDMSNSLSKSQELINKLNKVTDESVLHELSKEKVMYDKYNDSNSSSNNGTNNANNDSNKDDINSDNRNLLLNSTSKDNYITSYNPDTGDYEVYNTKNIFDFKEKDIESVNSKISSNSYLSKKFKNSNIIQENEKNKTIIFIIFGVIIMNLFAIRLYLKEKKEVIYEK